MKKIAIAAVVCLSTLPAHADHIGIYPEQVATVCVGPPPAPFTNASVYVVHQFSTGSTGSGWSVGVDLNGLVYVGSACISNPLIGDPINGAHFSYGGCLSAPITVCRIDFLYASPQPVAGCYHLQVEPYPGDTAVQVFDCADNAHDATGGYFSFELSVIFCDDCAVAVETTTWGAVKALYR